MKKLFIIANWKSNKINSEANSWLEEMANAKLPMTNDIEIIVCPPFTLLPTMNWSINNKKLPLKLGAQDVSPFAAGAYTGEVNAEQVKEYAEYAIIGHSERRTHLGESDDLLAKKVTQAIAAGLVPIFCVQNENTGVPAGVELVAYEPPTAIGSGKPDTPENAEKTAEQIMNKYGAVKNILYGGSVTADNIDSFTKMDHISGVLVGGASLDAVKFINLVKSASV